MTAYVLINLLFKLSVAYYSVNRIFYGNQINVKKATKIHSPTDRCCVLFVWLFWCKAKFQHFCWFTGILTVIFSRIDWSLFRSLWNVIWYTTNKLTILLKLQQNIFIKIQDLKLFFSTTHSISHLAQRKYVFLFVVCKRVKWNISSY